MHWFLLGFFSKAEEVASGLSCLDGMRRNEKEKKEDQLDKKNQLDRTMIEFENRMCCSGG